MIRKVHITSPFDGLNISTIATTPEVKPKAVIFIIHGISGKKERFLPFMEYMTDKGYACIAHDHRGHGESVLKEEDRGYSYKGRSAALTKDMRAVTGWINENFPDTPIYMLGHSMGSLAARAYIRENDTDLDGLILCGSPSYNPLTWLGMMMIKPISLIRQGRIRPIIFQKLMDDGYNRKFKSEGEKAWVCSDSNVRKTVKEDPSCNFSLTADYSVTLLELMHKAYSRRGWLSSNNSMPVLFLAGSEDPCIIDRHHFLLAVDAMRNAGYANVDYRLFPGMRHEVLNEIGKEEVWSEIICFLESDSD